VARFPAHTILLLTLTGAAACSNPVLSPKDTITTVIGAPVQSLNPLYSTDANSQHLNELSHASLVRTSARLVPEPYLAESFKLLGDKTIHFKLKKACRFPDGKEITADDVERSLNIFLDPENKATVAETFKKIKKFEKLNSHEFRFTTEKPEPALLSDLSLLKILPEGAIKKGENASVVAGSGPFRVVSFAPNQISFERNPVSCLPEPGVQKIKVKVVRDDISRFLKLKNGELDIVLGDMNYRKVEMIQKDPTLPLEVKIEDGIGYNYLGVNMINPKLRDPRVREALALSFDIPTIIRYKSRGMAKPSRNLLADQNYYSNLSIPIRVRDLAKARELLDAAGYNNGSNGKPTLKVTLTTNTNMISVENARVLAAQAKEAGIDLQHRAYEWGIFYADVKAGNTELYLLRWVGVTDPGIYFDTMHSGEIGRNNRTRYSNPEMDKWIELGQSVLDPTKRKLAFDKVQEIAHRDQPFIGLWHVKNTAVFRKGLKNVNIHPTGSWQSLLEMRKE
jgi:peptide/nickel transport system substrate-binding protein